MERYLQAGMHLKRPGYPSEYKIVNTVGTGSSCAVYYAEFVDPSGIRTEHLLKEYNPKNLKLVRDESGTLHVCSEIDTLAFEAGLLRFKDGYEMQLNVRRSSASKNSTSNIQCVFDANGTRYIDMTVMAGETYEKIEEKSLYNLLRRIEAITNVVGSYHENGLLHLDIKPDNILTLPETVELVQMFDFDSVIEKSEIPNAVYLSYTKSWAAQEQLLPNRRNRICEATDIFAIGEILFYKLMGRHSEFNERCSFSTFTFDYSNELFKGVNPRIYPLLSNIIKHTICNVVSERYQSTSELLDKLKLAIGLSNPHEAFLQHHLPSKVSYFIGRDKELQEIEERLKENNKLFISGMGGMGKSELVRQYAHAHKIEYDAVIFAVCNTNLENMVLDDLMLPVNNIQQWPDEKSKDYFNRKYRELERLCDEKVLIIVDNFNDMQDNVLNKLMQLNCKMLITTRCDVAEYNYEQLTLGTLEEEYIWDIFCTWYKIALNNDEHDAVQQILALYQGHTMAVELIAKQMRASGIKPKEMINKLYAGGFSDSGRERVVHTKDDMNTKLNIHAHIRRLFDVSELSEKQIRVLANLSLIPPSGIIKRQFRDWCKLDSYEDINDLTESGWIRQEPESDLISLHPVIADIMLDELENQFSLCETMIKTITWFIHKEMPDDKQDSLYGELPCLRYSRLIPIVINILKKICGFDSLPTMGIHFIITAATNLFKFGSIELYITFIEKACDTYKKLPKKDHGIVIKLLNARGMLLSANCDYQLAENFYNEALELAVVHYGESDEKTLAIRHNLVSTYHEWEKKDKLEEYYAQMRSLFVNESKRRFSASAYNGMGLFAKYLGFYEDSECFYREALSQRISDHGINHGLTGLAHLNLGALYLTQENLEEAEEHLTQACSIFNNYYGERHSYTATAYAHSGDLSLKRGQYEQAETFFQKALRIRIDIYGKCHLDTSRSYSDMGAVSWQQNKTDMAQQYYEEATTIRKSLLGENHISLSTLLCHLGSLQMKIGNLLEAEKNLLEAERISLAHYGSSAFHPDIAMIKNALGILNKEKGNYDAAFRYCSEALCIWQHTYGETHSHIAIAYINLGVICRENNIYEKAVQKLTEAIRILEQIHGTDSISNEASSAYSALGKTYTEMGEFEPAEDCYKKALKIRMNIFGESHPSVKLVCQRIHELDNKRKANGVQ